MDPHAPATEPVVGFLNNIDVGLVRRGLDMALQPSLATSWEPIGSEGWRFTLRNDVTCHDGATVDAKDAVFSFERAASENSDVKTFFAAVERIEPRDPLTMEFGTKQPDPLFVSGIANWLIMDKDWREDQGAASPDAAAGLATNLETNGTGPFRLISRALDGKTALKPFAWWWDTAEQNIARAVYHPMPADGAELSHCSPVRST